MDDIQAGRLQPDQTRVLARPSIHNVTITVLSPSLSLTPSLEKADLYSLKNTLFLIKPKKMGTCTHRKITYDHSGSPKFPDELKDKRIQTIPPGQELLDAFSRYLALLQTFGRILTGS
jgi:hypothetical protein